MEQVQAKISIRKLITRKGVLQLHLLLSISVFAFFFTYYYDYYHYCYSLLSNSVNDHAFHIQLLLTHGIDKTYVFLICNGILVVLVKTSSSLVSQSRFDLKEHVYIKTIHEALHTQYEDDFVEDAELEIRVVHGDEDDMKFITENFGETPEESNKRFDEFIRKRKEELSLWSLDPIRKCNLHHEGLKALKCVY